ncbi:hypothetical protein [Caloranaerobacter ferrireducens]|nr:hypothetical protein [Caloranaerobacter ferrireducens]
MENTNISVVESSKPKSQFFFGGGGFFFIFFIFFFCFRGFGCILNKR